MIMRDHYYGFRDPITFEESEEPYWLDWDYALADALQTIEDHTNQHGILVWEAESERVEISAVKKIDKFEAAKTARTSGKKYKAAAGEYWVPKVDLRGGEWPTHEEWISEMVTRDEK